VYRNCTVYDDPPGGNGNGRFDPGEDGELVVQLRNAGNQSATGVRTVLRSTDARFVITDSLAGYGEIPSCSTRSNEADRFEVSVDAGIPMETPVNCDLFVFADGYFDTLRLVITVGQIRTVDPIPDGPRQPPVYWAYDDVDTYYTQHPTFDWVETRGRGTRLTLSDDQTVQVDLPTGFLWRYYGQDYNQISVCGNGWVAPGYTTVTTYYNTALPSASMPAFVALVWDDLYPPTGGGVWYFYDEPNHRFIVEWDSVAYYSPQTAFDKYQLVIYDSTQRGPDGNTVVIAQYLTADNYGSITVGMQDPSLTVAIQCLFDGAYHRGTAPLAARRAIKYSSGTPTTGVDDNLRHELGRGLDVSVWPNPFPEQVSFQVGANRGTPVRIGVYDNNGRLVRNLDATGNGLTSLTWDGRDELGRSVVPGVYFYRVSAAGRTGSGKLILAR
jgi:hypothetical protein